jgi:CRISPR-associated protein Cas1
MTCELTPDAVPFSLTELEHAWDRVHERNGCPGADGFSVAAFGRQASKRLARLATEVAEGLYRPLPLRQVLVGKRGQSGAVRRLLVPAVRDRIAQTAAARRVQPELEDLFLDASFAYRPRRGVNSAVARVCALRDAGFDWVLDGDIEAFFDSVDHERLRHLVAALVQDQLVRWLVEVWLSQRIWTGRALLPIHKGLPQGSPLSPLLSNLVLATFDERLMARHFKVVRYADDFVVLTRSKDGAGEAVAAVEEELARLGLRLNAAKTRVTSFVDGFAFLGVHFRGRDAWIPWKREAERPRMVELAAPMPAAMCRALLAPRRSRKGCGVASASTARCTPSAVPVLARPAEEREMEDEMPVLYIAEQGAIVRRSGARILVEKSGDLLLDAPLCRYEAVVLFGNIQVTSHALSALAEAGLRVALLTRQGALRAMVVPEARSHIHLRISQFRRFTDAAFCLPWARRLVMCKVAGALSVLERYHRNGGANDPAASEQLSALHTAAREAADLPTLMGMEGMAARTYFAAVMRHNVSGLEWRGRQRRPSKDPINALLSLGYTILGNEIRGVIAACGLDACLGFLHQPADGRPALALDLLEPYRHTVVDRLVLTLINRGTLKATDFTTSSTGEGLFLEPRALRRFLTAYEEWVDRQDGSQARTGGPPCNYRARVRRDVLRVVAALDRDLDFDPEEVPV